MILAMNGQVIATIRYEVLKFKTILIKLIKKI